MSNSKNVNNPASSGQQKKVNTIPTKRFNYTWWMQTVGALLGYKPSLTDRAFTVALDVADLVRDAIAEFYHKIYSLFSDIENVLARAARTIANMVLVFAKKMKSSFFQMCTFLAEVCGVSGDSETKDAFENLAKNKTSKKSSRGSGDSAGVFVAQGGEETDEHSDFFIIRLITQAIAGVTTFFGMLPTMDKSLTRLNAAFSLFSNLDRFDFIRKGKWLVNVVYKWLTGEPFFEEVEKNSEFTALAKSIGEQLDGLEVLRNPNLSTLIDLRTKEKRLQTLYHYLILATPAKANQFTTIFSAIQKRTARYAGNVQGMQGRIKPIVLCMSGSAGVGKTTVQRRLEKDIMSYISMVLKDAQGDDVAVFAEHATRPSSFSRNCVEMTPEYDDGYCNPFFFILEEFQTMKSTEVNTQWAAKLLRYADSGPLLLNFAFGEKGTRYFDSPFIIATGNYHEKGHHVPFQDAFAYYRRIEFDVNVTSIQKKGEVFDIVRHTRFVFTKECIDAHKRSYVTNAIKTYNVLFPKRQIDMSKYITYSQLVVIMSLAYLERINPNNERPDAADTFGDIKRDYSPASYAEVLNLARSASFTFHGDENVSEHHVGVHVDDVVIDSADSDSDDVSGLGPLVELSGVESEDDDDDGTGIFQKQSFVTNDGIRNPVKQGKLPPVALAFVQFVNEFTLWPAYAYAEKLHTMLKSFVAALQFKFTFPLPESNTFYGRSENVYALYGNLFRSFIGIKKKYERMTQATRKDVAAIMASVRWLVGESKSIIRCCTFMTSKQLSHENSSVGSLLVREAYVGGMTAIQRTALRAQVDYKLAPSVALEKKNIIQMKKSIAWRRTRIKRNEKRRAAQFAKRDAARNAMVSRMREGSNREGNGKGRIINDYYWDQDSEEDDEYDDWSDLIELQNIHTDQVSMSHYQENDGYARVSDDKRKFVRQVYYDLEDRHTTLTVPGEKLRAFIGCYEWKASAFSFLFGSPSTPLDFSHSMYKEIVTKEHCKIFLAHRLVHFTNGVVAPKEFDSIINRIDKVDFEKVLAYCSTVVRTQTPYEFVVATICFFDVKFDDIGFFSKSIKVAELLEYIVAGSFNTGDEAVAVTRSKIRDVGMSYADFGPFLAVCNDMLLERKKVHDFNNYLQIVCDDEYGGDQGKSILDFATIVILGVMLSSVIALVCHCCGKTDQVDELTDMMSNLDGDQLNQVQEALDCYKAESMDNKRPMAKPAKRANVLARYQQKFVKESGNANSIRDLVMQNTYACIDGPNSNLYGSLVMLGGTLGIMNRHVFSALSKFVLLPYVPTLNKNQTLNFPKSQVNVIQEFPDTDTILLSFPSVMRQHASVHKHLITRAEYKRGSLTEAAILSYDELDELVGKVHPLSDLRVRKDETFPIYDHQGRKDFDIKQRVSYSWRASRPGACASPVVAVVHGCAKLVAFHAAGNGTGYGVGVPLFKEDLAVYFDKNLVTAQGYYPKCGETICFENSDPILDSYVVSNESITTSRHTSPTNTTTFVPTPFKTFEFGGGAPGRPADLSGRAYVNHLLKEEKTKEVFNVPDCVYAYAEEFKAEICDLFTSTDKNEMKGCRTLTNEEAIYGFDNIDPIDYTTSDGILCKLMNVRKRDLSDPQHPSVQKVCDYLDESERIKREDGHYCYQLNTDSLKDEIRDHERVDQKKTRVFNVTDALNNIEIKKATGHMVSKMKRTLMLGPAMCGINPTCSLWSMIYQDFEGGNVVFTDVSGFDFAAVKWLFIILSYWLHLCYGHSRFGFDYAMWAFLSCLQGIRFAYGFGRVLNRGNTSGNWITTVMNTMVNTIFHAVAVIHLATIHGDDPRLALKRLIVILYSDDNVSRLDYPWWTTKNVVKTFKELFNITLTGVDKGDLSDITDETYTIDDAEFLCRKFVKRDGIIYAPLSRDSLLTQLYWVRMPKNAPEGYLYVQLQQNIDNVMRELCEYPQDEAIQIVEDIRLFVEQHELPVQVVPFEYRRGADLKMEYY